MLQVVSVCVLNILVIRGTFCVTLLCTYTVHTNPNLCNSEPSSARSTLAMEALYSEDLKLYSDTSSITPRQLVIELHALE